jgi:hypothetical protein
MRSVLKSDSLRADDSTVMDNLATNITSAEPKMVDQESSDSKPTSSATDAIAISATDLIRMINDGHGSDVNDLVSRMLHDRRAA